MVSEKIVIIGAGPAGMRAALTLVSHGLCPIVIDEGNKSGGQIYRRPLQGLDGVRSGSALYGFEASKADRLHRAFDALGDNIDYRPASTIWDIDQRQLQLVTADQPVSLAWERIILAAGAMDRIIPLKGWTLPGAYSLGGAQIALKAQAVGIGARVVFFGTGPLLYLVAYQYAKAGIDVAGVLDTSPFPPLVKAVRLLRGGATIAKGVYFAAWLQAHGVRIERGITPLEVTAGAEGAVAGIRYADRNGAERLIKTPAVGFGYGLKSETQIADLLGLEFSFDRLQRQWLPTQDQHGRSSDARVYLAGDGARVRGADVAELTGERAALALLADGGKTDVQRQIDGLTTRIAKMEPFRHALEQAFPFPDRLARTMADDVTLCRCEGLAAEALRNTAKKSGENDINRLKAFTRLGMGRCQGRICGPAAAEVLSELSDRPIAEIGRIRGQAPIKPVPLAILAKGAGRAGEACPAARVSLAEDTSL